MSTINTEPQLPNSSDQHEKQAIVPRLALRSDRTQIMGVLNCTPDSFSDGGRYVDVDSAVTHALTLVGQGADIIDVGGESTRPGAERVDPEEERRRIIPAIEQLAARGIAVSVDTMNASTALAAAAAGAALINDVSGGLADEAMVDAVLETGLPFVVMHWRGHSSGMAGKANYTRAAHEVRTELYLRAAELIVRGVDPEKLIVDPGIGFAKNADHNWQVLGALRSFTELGLPVLVGVSRKRFLGELLPEGAPAEDRDQATAIASALAAEAGAWAVRVHEVERTRSALDVSDAWRKGARG